MVYLNKIICNRVFFYFKRTELEDTLKTHQNKVDSIKNIIWQTGLKNNNISSILNGLTSNDTKKFMTHSIDTAVKVSKEMRELHREALGINNDVFKLKIKLASLEPQWDAKFGLAEENGSVIGFLSRFDF